MYFVQKMSQRNNTDDLDTRDKGNKLRDIWEDFSLGTSIAGVRFINSSVSYQKRFRRFLIFSWQVSNNLISESHGYSSLLDVLE